MVQLDASVKNFEHDPNNYVLRVKNNKIFAEKNGLITWIKKNLLGFDSYKLPTIMKAFEQVDNVQYNGALKKLMESRVNAYKPRHSDGEKIQTAFQNVFNLKQEKKQEKDYARTSEESAVMYSNILPLKGIMNDIGSEFETLNPNAIQKLLSVEFDRTKPIEFAPFLTNASTLMAEALTLFTEKTCIQAKLPDGWRKVPSSYINEVDVINADNKKVGTIIINPDARDVSFVFSEELRERVIAPPPLPPLQRKQTGIFGEEPKKKGPPPLPKVVPSTSQETPEASKPKKTPPPLPKRPEPQKQQEASGAIPHAPPIGESRKPAVPQQTNVSKQADGVFDAMEDYRRKLQPPPAGSAHKSEPAAEKRAEPSQEKPRAPHPQIDTEAIKRAAAERARRAAEKDQTQQ